MAAVITAEGGAMKYWCIEIILLKKLLFISRLNKMNLRFTMAHFICAEWYKNRQNTLNASYRKLEYVLSFMGAPGLFSEYLYRFFLASLPFVCRRMTLKH